MGSIKDEVTALNTLDHPAIVKYFETYNAKKFVYLVMEFIEGDTLDTQIRVNNAERTYGERTVASIMEDLLKAVNHVHNA